MYRIDHLVINVDREQIRGNLSAELKQAGYPYKPEWGKGTKGFKVSNLWIGDEYLEMVTLKRPDGGGWKQEWVTLYNNHHRGLICLMLETDSLDEDYKRIRETVANVSEPEYLRFKWFFNLFTRTMPWRNSYLPFFEGIPLQLGLQQMKDEKAKEFMYQYMYPNSRDNGITGIQKVIIYGNLSQQDREMLRHLFGEICIGPDEISISLQSNQELIFRQSDKHFVEVFTTSENNKGKAVAIANVHLITG